MLNKYWWILPLIIFVIPIIYRWTLKKFKEKEPPEYDDEYDSALDRDFRPTVAFIICWIIAGALVVGHFIYGG